MVINYRTTSVQYDLLSIAVPHIATMKYFGFLAALGAVLVSCSAADSTVCSGVEEFDYPRTDSCWKYSHCNKGTTTPEDGWCFPLIRRFSRTENKCEWFWKVNCSDPPSKPTPQTPEEPQTKPTTEPPTKPPTEPPTKPPTEPPTKPPTEPPTKPPTEPPTKPPTEPPAQRRIQPSKKAETMMDKIFHSIRDRVPHFNPRS